MRILYCILNWGLGHATRSIPVIKALHALGYEVELASDGGPLALLRKTFPQSRFHELPGYDITYPSRKFIFNVPLMGRHLFRAVNAEKKHLAKLLSQHQYNAIISDNRYGCYDNGIPSILITHQLGNITPVPLLNIPGEWVLKKYISHFTEIWIPDTPDRVLSGRLTDVNLKNLRFIGHLSDQEHAPQQMQYDIAAILSGPEPQRSNFEREILPQLKTYPGKCVLVRGLINDDQEKQEGNVTIYPYMNRSGINVLLNSSRVILCRTGYSSLMDLMSVGMKAILIPTPGQPEQVYLGERMQGLSQFVVQKQGEVDVKAGINDLKNKAFVRATLKHDGLLDGALLSLIGRINGTAG